MANVKNGNTFYIDSTGDLTRTKGKLRMLIVTASGGAGRIILRETLATNPVKLDFRLADATSQIIDMNAFPMVFPTGINVGTLTNVVATAIIEEQTG